MNQVLQSQKLQKQLSLQTSNKQLTGPQLHNLNKHTSYVFAATLYNVVLEESFEKCNEINEQKDQNLDEQQWLQVKRELWKTKIERQGGQSLKQQKCFLASAGADKNIYLWDIDNMQLSSNTPVQIKPEQLPQYPNPNAQENQGNENQNNLNFSKDELDLRHVIIPYQQNLYEFVTCLLNIELNQNQSYLIAGYESNQIIRYQITGKYWMKGVKQIRYILNLSEVSQITRKLHSHNDAVRSMVYFNNQLCSCGDDMQLLIQNIDGEVIKRFYFDSIIENLCIWNGNLVFDHCTVNLKSTSESKEEILKLTQARLGIPEQNEENQNNANQAAGAGQLVQVERHIYTYGLQQCLMIMGENQQNNLNIQLNVLNYYPSLEDAYDQIDKITCFELSDNQNILYSTESGKLIKIKEPLKNEKNLEIKEDQYKDAENNNQKYQYKILNQFQSHSKMIEHNLNQILMSFIRYENLIYLFYKNKDQKEQVFLQVGEVIINSNDKFYEVVENNPLRIQYLQNQTENINQIIIKPYEVFLQNPILVTEGNTKIILLCGDQLRYYKL